MYIYCSVAILCFPAFCISPVKLYDDLRLTHDILNSVLLDSFVECASRVETLYSYEYHLYKFTVTKMVRISLELYMSCIGKLRVHDTRTPNNIRN